MQVIKDTTDFSIDGVSSVTLGKFDGVHRGHRALMDRVCAYADGSPERPAKVVFSLLIAQKVLLTRSERRSVLSDAGIDVLIECPFEESVMNMEAEDFVRDILRDRLHAVHVVVGADYHFGHERKGDAAMLCSLGEQEGFTVEILPKVQDEGGDISCTRIRSALVAGDMERVREMLGFSFFVDGTITHGRELGRKIGFPTANMIPGKEKLLPPNGVYYVRGHVDGESFGGVTNIGMKPTVNGTELGIETFLFDCSRDLYGKELRVELLHFARPERKFDSIGELTDQIARDREAGEAYYRSLAQLPESF